MNEVLNNIKYGKICSTQYIDKCSKKVPQEGPVPMGRMQKNNLQLHNSSKMVMNQ